MRRHGSVVFLPLLLALLLAACEPDGADSHKAVRADGPVDTSTTAAPATTSTTSTTVKPRPVATTTTTTTARPRPTTTTTAKPAPAPAPATSSSCHASYQGTCIPPDVSDADCYPGSGNGPHYVHENNVDVVGPDVFDLDRDGDGVGCES